MRCWLAMPPVVPEGVQNPHSRGTENSRNRERVFFPVLATLTVEEDRRRTAD